MTRKSKYKRLYERIVIVWLLIILATLWLLMAKTANAAGAEPVLNEVVIRMIETEASSVEADKMLTYGENEAGVYKRDTSKAETAQENAVTEYEALTESKPLEIEGFNPEWHYYITESELRLIALIAEREDRNAMAEIAGVILNRANSPKFPDSIDGVIYQERQFHTAGLITDEMKPSDEAVQAVTVVFRDGESTVGNSLFFAEKSIAKEKVARNLYLVDYRGQTAFWGQE